MERNIAGGWVVNLPGNERRTYLDGLKAPTGGACATEVHRRSGRNGRMSPSAGN
jgi:hypothetical protein